MSEKIDRINELQEKIEFNQRLYYNEKPEISDAEYDALENELRELDPKNKVFSVVGKDFDASLKKIHHIIHMGSLSKVSNYNEFNKWINKMNYSVFITQLKLDGISVELQYFNGKFKYGVTRGNGKIGDNITENIRKMAFFVPTISSDFTGAIRGEIILTKDVFAAKYPDAKNCRNMASGISKRKNGEGSKDLTIVVYDAISKNEDFRFKNELDKIEYLKTHKFNVVDTKIFNLPEDVIKYRYEIMSFAREKLNYQIDGLVIKGNEIDLEDMKRARPFKQTAFKFDPEEKASVVLNVEWSESGANYTPIAVIKPVTIAGTIVQRASLANPNLIEGLKLKIGSNVIISKRGDIIPKIERVINTPIDFEEIKYPTMCSVCNALLINKGTRLYCPNKNCSKRDYHRLLKWIKKLGVKNFGELILKQLFDGNVRKINDLYNLSVEDLLKLDRVGEKSAKKALNNLFAVKELSLSKFIGGFDLENIGESLVEKIVQSGYDTLEKISAMEISDLTKIELFGNKQANQFKSEFNTLYSDMQELLKTNKIKIRRIEMENNKLTGKSFCFTGKLDTMKRNEANQLVTENGGTPKNGVVKDLSYLVTNSTEQTSKYIKAQKQGTNIITEKKFLEMIRE